MNCKLIQKGSYRPTLAIGLMLATSVAFQSCQDDTLTGQPSWLGNSIYEELQKDGNYTVTTRLIDDLGLHDQMSRTGSVTLFAATDAAFDEWFKTNKWGVRSYDKLTLAQKKDLLNNSMINNAYLIELMSNVSADPPETGLAMRRPNSTSVFDSVYVMKHEDMNGTLPAWAWYKENKKDIILFKDGRMMSNGSTAGLSAPMIHFLPAFMRKQAFTDEDITILTNGVATSVNDAYVAGRKVVERDLTCKNGYIHKVDGVMEPATNMAEVIRTNPLTSQWGELLDRFSAPFYNHNATKEYNRLYNNQDSVFVKRYFSELSADGKLQYDSDNNKVGALLAFDPGWNHYMYSNTMGYDLHYDAGAMIVPTNDALTNWFESSALKRQFGKWENVTDLVLSKLLRVNMIDNFSEKVRGTGTSDPMI